MQTIKRDIYVTKNVLQAPIEVTEGTNSIAIEFDVRDYEIPASAAAVAYSLSTSSMEEPNKALADVSGNKITIIPSEAFFLPGQNVMQIRIIDGNSKLISFNIIVKCTGKMRFGDEKEEQQSTLVEQMLAKLGEYQKKSASPYNFKGSCLSSELPASGNTINDTYYCTDLKYRKTWNGSAWEQSSLNEADYEDELTKTNGEVSSLKEDLDIISKEYYSVKYNNDGTYTNPYGFNTTQGYSLSNLIPKNAIIKRIESKNNITNDVTFGIAFSDTKGKCLKIWDKTGFTGNNIDLDYITPSEGYLIIIVKSATTVQLAYSNVAINDAIGCNLIHYNGLPQGELPSVGTTYPFDISSDIIYPSFNVIYKKITEDFILNVANKYHGKKFAFIGDSLTAGYLEGGGYVARPYPTVVKDILGLSEVQNLGISSSSVSTSGNPTNAMSERYTSIDSDVDYICIMGGTNDHNMGSDIGTVTDTTVDTLYGALYVLFNGIHNTYPNAKLIYLIPIQKEWVDDNAKGLKFSDYLDAIRTMCKECSVETIDLYSRSGLSFKVQKMTEYYDGGLHLNQNGYEYLGKRIAELLLTI